MPMPPIPLTALSEAQRTQANARFAIIRSTLEKGVTQVQVVRNHDLPPSTAQRWIKNYQEKGLSGLAHASRSDKGEFRNLPDQAIQLIEGLAKPPPPRSVASIVYSEPWTNSFSLDDTENSFYGEINATNSGSKGVLSISLGGESFHGGGL